MPILITDDFNRANETPLAAPWTAVTGEAALNLASNQAQASSAANRNAAYYDQAIPDDQWAQMKVIAADGVGGNIGPIVRCSTSAESFYAGGTDRMAAGAPIIIWKRTAGTLATINSTTGDTALNDVWRLEITGSNLKLFQNDILVLTGSDGAFASGRAGMVLETVSGVNSIGDDFLAGDFASSASVPLVGSGVQMIRRRAA